MYIRTDLSTPTIYPLKELRRDNPRVSFPSEIPESMLASYNVYPLTISTPEYNPDRQILVSGPIELQGDQWVMTRIVQDIPIEELREDASLTRREFCLALSTAGTLTVADAISAAKGNWPEALLGFLEYLDAAQSADAQIEWAATGSIDRLHPFVLTMASWLGLTDGEVDALFGIGP